MIEVPFPIIKSRSNFSSKTSLSTVGSLKIYQCGIRNWNALVYNKKDNVDILKLFTALGTHLYANLGLNTLTL
jgi:hypothetical protein